MAQPHVPNIKTAAWRRPYRFSGRFPLWGFLWMIVAGCVTALIAGVGGYFGGAVTHWLVVQLSHLSAAILKGLMPWLVNQGWIGNGVAFAVTLMVMFIPTLFVGILYPALIGAIAGSGVAGGASVGKCRTPILAGFLGLLAGGAAYAGFLWTSQWLQAPFQLSSRVLPSVVPPFSTLLMAVESLIVIITAKMAARTPYKNPFCESCKEWFGAPKTVVIPLTGAEALVNALSSGSALPLQGISINATSAEQIQVDLACCDCHASGYVLTATLRWAEERKGEIKSKTQPWFSTIVPSALGAEIERWTAAATQPPPAQAQVQTSAPQHTQEAMPHSPAAPAPATASVIPVAVEPSPPATQPDKQTSSTEICKRCGRSMNTASCTCPHCGHTQWGMVIGTTLFSLVCLGVTVLGGSRISAAFWRSIVMWGGGVIGGLVLLVAVVWIGKGLLTHQKPLSEISSAVSVTLEPTPTAEVVTPPTVVAALVPDPIQATPVVKPPEIDWLSISRLCQEGDFEAVTRLLVTLDKRSDLEYTTDKDAYDKTCRLIKEVGTQLDRKGGEDLMRQVLTRAGALGCNTRFVEREWNGIGSWWG